MSSTSAAPTTDTKFRRGLLFAAVSSMAALSLVAATAGPGGVAQASTASTSMPRSTSTEAALKVGLDGVISLSPPDTCLAVSIDGEIVYRHAADRPLVPASTHKLLTAAVALHELSPEFRFRTTVVAGTAPTDGVIAGDLALVGGGDPLLTSDVYAFVRHMDRDLLTSLDALADSVAASGITKVTGRIIGDESRYDGLRSVPSWPDRYLRQNQIGPLSALSVDDGYALRMPSPGTDDPVRRDRSEDPAFDAARIFKGLLQDRGIEIGGFPASASAPVDGFEVAVIESAPLTGVVKELLGLSDNGTAELLTKELGVATGAGGSTAGGTDAITRGATDLGFPMEGTTVVDGSGLDSGNRATCDELVAVLESSGGADGPLGSALPVAGESGTLSDRFEGTAAEGRLRAKTGTLNTVTSLAGFVDLTTGGTATFAYVANGTKDEGIMHGQELLGALLGDYEPECSTDPVASVVAPVSPYVAQVGVMAAVPMPVVLVPAVLVPMEALVRNGEWLIGGCLAGVPGFSVSLS